MAHPPEAVIFRYILISIGSELHALASDSDFLAFYSDSEQIQLSSSVSLLTRCCVCIFAYTIYYLGGGYVTKSLQS